METNAEKSVFLLCDANPVKVIEKYLLDGI